MRGIALTREFRLFVGSDRGSQQTTFVNCLIEARYGSMKRLRPKLFDGQGTGT